ncbi:hypothetical protein [Candidatus Neoehrlichia procyonis]|uniref:Uncharacterized protein n=1 Tax=Candidatus Neoehrlichia procyonis str. RAC413 TaxID=1359163 RepID=A0A0F3NQL3_9RICK|nr:hypothetical protein [Candidatus Neoehrlichia lotoris]KJV69179.1 hypothetical protein NLO413_0556 [Candidatus Neoehrlichia lotoris str. RAC413]
MNKNIETYVNTKSTNVNNLQENNKWIIINHVVELEEKDLSLTSLCNDPVMTVACENMEDMIADAMSEEVGLNNDAIMSRNPQVNQVNVNERNLNLATNETVSNTIFKDVKQIMKILKNSDVNVPTFVASLNNCINTYLFYAKFQSSKCKEVKQSSNSNSINVHCDDVATRMKDINVNAVKQSSNIVL